MKINLINRLMWLLSCFLPDQRGNIAIFTALAAMPLLLVVSLATDYGLMTRDFARLQKISDSAALAAAAEFGLSSTTVKTITEVAKAYVHAHDKDVNVKVAVDEENSEVTVRLSKFWKPLIIHHIDSQTLPIKTKAVAAKVGTNNLCVLTLHDTDKESLIVLGKSSITAPDCSIHANSLSNNAIVLKNKSKLVAKSICSVGGYSSPANAMTPTPMTDCPTVPDPLVNRTVSASSSCDYTNIIVAKIKTTLNPGRYCGGLLITDGAEVQLRSGVYKFVDGALVVDNHSKISGKYVTLHFSGSKSKLHFTNASAIELKALDSGPTAGLLIMADKTTDPDTVFKIHSLDAKEFTGLIYTPNNHVEIGADTKAGDTCAVGGIHGPNCKHPREFCETSFGQFSDWTAIVSKNLKINDGVTLVMNTDYKNSDVPFPKSLVQAGGLIRLVK